MRVVALCSLLLATAPLAAQGTVSGQGYGYPPGALGTRTQGTGGALTQFDEETPVNPGSTFSMIRSSAESQPPAHPAFVPSSGASR